MSEKYYPSIKNLESYYNGWQWDIGNSHYRTDRYGDGLWYCGDEDKQFVGTCQFFLPYYNKRKYDSAYSKIRRFFVSDNYFLNFSGE